MIEHRRVLSGVWILGIVLLVSQSVWAADWGTLKGRFVYDGTPPPQKKLIVSKDTQVCSQHPPLDESLVVAEDGGLANAVIYVRPKRGKKLAVHADYEASAGTPVELNNERCRFDPHIALVRTGQKLVIRNSDPIGHNTKADCFKNQSFNVLIPSGGAQEITSLSVGERLPVGVSCNIHPWMSGYLVVSDTPYMAVSATDGAFEIKNIPSGTHEFQFWQEKSGYLKNVAFEDGKTDKRGRAKIKIAEGVTDLGEIKVSQKLFAGK